MGLRFGTCALPSPAGSLLRAGLVVPAVHLPTTPPLFSRSTQFARIPLMLF